MKWNNILKMEIDRSGEEMERNISPHTHTHFTYHEQQQQQQQQHAFLVHILHKKIFLKWSEELEMINV